MSDITRPAFAGDDHIRQQVNEVVDRLIAARKNADVSQPHMAKLLGSSLGRIRHMESGDMDPIQVRLDTVYRYIHALGGTVEVVINLPEPAAQPPAEPAQDA